MTTGGARSGWDRFTDMIARKPSGPLGRLLFRYPVAHRAGFAIALELVPPQAGDAVLDVGCGGSIFLRDALRSGCRAVGLDHSPDMLATARTVNVAAIRANRLTLVEGDAGALGFADASFDKVFCLNAFFFFPKPVAAITEMARVTRPGGSVVILTTPSNGAEQAPGLFGPLVERMRCDDPETLGAWGVAVGLAMSRVESVPKSGYLCVFQKPVREPSAPQASRV